MAPIAALIVRVAADLSELRGGVDQVNQKMDSLGVSAKQLGIALASTFSAQAVIGFAKDAAASFAAEEAAVQKLTTALQAQGQATPAVIDQYAALAAEFQRTTVNSDELIVEMQALLVQVGGVMPGQMKGALQAATDLSAGLGIDLRTATMLVGKAFAGETGTLKRYGIVIDESALKTDAAGAVMAAINEKFGGQSQAQIETYSGKLAVLGNQMDEVKEIIGNAIATVLSPLIDIFLDMHKGVQGAIVVLGGLVGAAAPVVVATMGIQGAFAAILPFLGPVGWIAAGVIAVVAVWRNWDTIVEIARKVYEAIKNYLVDRFNEQVERIKQKVDAVTGFFKGMYDKVVGRSFVPDMIDGIASQFSRLNSVMVSPTQMASGAVQDIFSALGQKVSGIVGGMLEGVGGMFGNFLQSVLPGFIGNVIGMLGGKLMGWIGGLFQGGEEGKHVNPARDAFLAQFGPGGTGPGSGFFELAALLTDQGRGDLFNALRTSDTMAEFNAAVAAINAFLQGGGSHGGGGGGGAQGGGNTEVHVYVGNEELDSRTVQVTRGAMGRGEIPVPESSLQPASDYA